MDEIDDKWPRKAVGAVCTPKSGVPSSRNGVQRVKTLKCVFNTRVACPHAVACVRHTACQHTPAVWTRSAAARARGGVWTRGVGVSTRRVSTRVPAVFDTACVNTWRHVWTHSVSTRAWRVFGRFRVNTPRRAFDTHVATPTCQHTSGVCGHLACPHTGGTCPHASQSLAGAASWGSSPRVGRTGCSNKP